MTNSPAGPATTEPAHDDADVASLDRTLSRDDALVHDTLCALQAPSGLTRVSDMMTAAGLRTQRGSAFNPTEVRRGIDRLVTAGHAIRDVQGRVRAAAPFGEQRFQQLMRDRRRALAWFEAWRKLSNFDHAYSLGYQEEEQLVAAQRLVIFGGTSEAHVKRLAELAYGAGYLWLSALRRAVLQPFDPELFGRLEPALQTALAERLMTVLSGFSETIVRPLEDWLLDRIGVAPSTVSADLRCRLAETLLFRGQFAAARALCANLEGGRVEALQAALSIAEGRWEGGAIAFELALKHMASELGRRKNLASPSLGWLYLMALLAQTAPAAWSKARKFASAEAGPKESDPTGLWGVWLDAIDQRLGDAGKAPERFRLAQAEGSGLHSLQYLQHLLLAAWLRLEVPAPDELRAHATALSREFERADMAWLARLARRAAASLLAEPAAPEDAAMPFLVGEAQDRWREALAAILALGAGTAAAPRGRGGALQDRLLWAVAADAEGRIERLEPLEQKAGVRGLGKPKEVSLATLIKRKDLPAHDAAVLRAVEREDYGNRPVLDIANAAPALVGHPGVVWMGDASQIIQVSEALPALEIMTQGEHISFRLLDPVRTARHKADEAADELLPQRWRQQRARLRNLMLLDDGTQRARLVRLTPAQLRVAELIAQGWKVPVSARAELDAALRVLTAHFQVTSDADTGHEVEPSAMLRAELTPRGEGLALRLLAAPFGDFGPRLVPGRGRERVTTVHEGVTLSTRRELAREVSAVQGLLEAVDFLDDDVHEWLLEEPEQALATVEGLSRLGETIVSEWPKGKPLRVRSVADAAVTLRASSKGEWLDIDGELELDGSEVLRLRRLLELAQASRSRFVALGEGDFLALSDALRRQLIDLAALVQPTAKDGLRLAGVAAMAWEAGGHGIALQGDAAWRKRSQAWAKSQQQIYELPAGLTAELRDYQLEGYRWLMRLAASGFGAVLADDMGLGKTLQTLALLLARAGGGPALVVAPTSVCGNWLQEAARFAPGLQVALYGDGLGGEEVADESGESSNVAATVDEPVATVRQAARLRQIRALGPGHVLLCSYTLLQIDSALLSSPVWHSVVLDEAQAIKNASTRRAKAAQSLEADFRLALTGTPVENRLGELASIMGFCNPGLLGSAEQFARRFANPIERGDDPQAKALASRRLRRLLSPFLLRRTKAEVLTDLPPRTEIVHEVLPGPKERALLEALRQQAAEIVAQAVSARGGGAGRAQFNVLAALTRLRRAACDPRLVAPEQGIVGAKVQEFERLAIELVAGHHKALVFSQFTDFLALLRDRLDLAGLSYQYLDGSTPAAERGKRVAAFQAGQGELFLISLKAGGFGLNLTVADYVIITDPWWNPATEEQASARAHRIGQQRPVTVYRLVTKGSIEEKIVDLHRSKRDLAEGILQGGEVDAPINAAQLMELLRAE